ELAVRCLPTAIPEHLTVDVAHLRVGGSLHVRDLPPYEGIEIVSPPEEVIAAVATTNAEEVVAPAEAAAPAEPEVIGREAAAAAGAPFLLVLREGEVSAEQRSMMIVVGLGNPGRRYRGTRHNVGQDVARRLADRFRIRLEGDGRAAAGKARVGSATLVLAIPE